VAEEKRWPMMMALPIRIQSKEPKDGGSKEENEEKREMEENDLSIRSYEMVQWSFRGT